MQSTIADISCFMLTYLKAIKELRISPFPTAKLSEDSAHKLIPTPSLELRDSLRDTLNSVHSLKFNDAHSLIQQDM